MLAETGGPPVERSSLPLSVAGRLGPSLVGLVGAGPGRRALGRALGLDGDGLDAASSGRPLRQVVRVTGGPISSPNFQTWCFAC